jgi:hypothetical protein
LGEAEPRTPPAVRSSPSILILKTSAPRSASQQKRRRFEAFSLATNEVVAIGVSLIACCGKRQ